MSVPLPAQDDALNLEEMRSLWPQTDEGRLCARLLRRYAITKLIDSSLASGCTDRAQAESGANKAMASMAKDFATLAVPVAKKEPRVPLPTLHRFQSQEDKPKTEPKTQ